MGSLSGARRVSMRRPILCRGVELNRVFPFDYQKQVVLKALWPALLRVAARLKDRKTPQRDI
jgi:hypothetical protein